MMKSKSLGASLLMSSVICFSLEGRLGATVIARRKCLQVEQHVERDCQLSQDGGDAPRDEEQRDCHSTHDALGAHRGAADERIAYGKEYASDCEDDAVCHVRCRTRGFNRLPWSPDTTENLLRPRESLFAPYRVDGVRVLDRLLTKGFPCKGGGNIPAQNACILGVEV